MHAAPRIPLCCSRGATRHWYFQHHHQAAAAAVAAAVSTALTQPLVQRTSCRAASSGSDACRAPSSSSSSRGVTAAASTAAAAAAAVYLAPSETHLQHLAASLAAWQQPGDVYLLYGAVGAGKSTFSRAFIRAAAEDPTLPVPSPTYLLQIMYDEQEGPPIHHFDLYRLEQQQQQQQDQQQQQQSLARLDLPTSFSTAVSLIEWPDRLPLDLLPQQHLEVRIDTLDSSSSSSSGGGGWQQQGSVVVPLPAEVSLQQAAEGLYGGDESPDSSSDLDPYTDSRPRRVTLVPHGQHWRQRLAQLAAALTQQ